MFNWKLWGKGLLSAAIGGVVASATNALADPSALGRPKELAAMAGAGAAIGALGYLKTHPPVEPLPDELEAVAAAGIGIAVGKAAKKLPKPKR
jgi:hypothetical protein